MPRLFHGQPRGVSASSVLAAFPRPAESSLFSFCPGGDVQTLGVRYDDHRARWAVFVGETLGPRDPEQTAGSGSPAASPPPCFP